MQVQGNVHHIANALHTCKLEQSEIACTTTPVLYCNWLKT